MSELLLLGNPRKRKAKHAKRAKRKQSPAQRAAFLKMIAARGRGKVKRHAKRRIKRNPVARHSRRRMRRNPINAGAIRASFSGVKTAVTSAVLGATGAIAVDIAMGQAAKVLPAGVVSKIDAAGSVNWSYYAVKGALAIGLGVAGAKFLPGAAKGAAAKMANGSLVVMGYEILRMLLPADLLTLGYYSAGQNAGNVTNMGAYLRNKQMAGLRGTGAYLRGMGAPVSASKPARVGEGVVR